VGRRRHNVLPVAVGNVIGAQARRLACNVLGLHQFGVVNKAGQQLGIVYTGVPQLVGQGVVAAVLLDEVFGVVLQLG